MSNYAAVAAEAGDKYLAALAEGQDRIVEYVRASRQFVPPMPFKAAEQPAFVPFTMHSMQEVASLQFKLAGELLEQQRKFFQTLYGLGAKPSTAKPTARSAASAAKPKRASKSRPSKKKAPASKTTTS